MKAFHFFTLTLTTTWCILTHSQAQSDRLSPEDALAKLVVADGLQVKTFAADPEIVSISNIDVDHRGRVWACECVNYRGNRGKRPEGDRILILEDTDGDGVSDKQTVFYQGTDIDIAMGLCVLGNKAIVSVSPDILLLEDTDGDDKADKKSVILSSDAVFQHDHSLHSFVFGPDGRFYGNFGNTGKRLKDPHGNTIIDRADYPIVDAGKPYWGGMVFRCDRAFKSFEVLGHNFRNNYEAAIDSFGSVWQSDNDDDGNLAVRLNYILEGGNYGYLDERTGERWRAPRISAHPFKGKAHWHQNDPGAVPNVIETGNGAPGGVTIYEGRLLPSATHDQVIFCDAGQHVVWALPVTQSGAGYQATKFEILRSPDNNFRPIDAAVAPDGSLFVSDWYDPVIGGFGQDDIERGRLYWIAPKDHHYQSPNYEFTTAKGAAQALCSPNSDARYLAWMALHAMGITAEPALTPLLGDSNPRIRARAFWLLGQLDGRESHYLEIALNDPAPNIRVTGLRLAALFENDLPAVINRLATDPSPHVRAECAVHLRHLEGPQADNAWAILASQHDGADRWYLEALGIGATGNWDTRWAALEASNAKLSQTTQRDLIWRSRASISPTALANLVLTADKDYDLRRYVRALDFQPDTPSKRQALRDIAQAQHLSPEIALAALTRLPDLSKADSDIAKRLVSLLPQQAPSVASMRLVKQLEAQGAYPWLLQVAQSNHETRLEAITSLLDLQQQPLLTQALGSQDLDKAQATGIALAQAQRPDAFALIWPFIGNDRHHAAARKATARETARFKLGAEQLLDRIEAGDFSEELKQAVASTLLTHPDQAVRERAERLFPLGNAIDAKPIPKLSALLEQQGDAENGHHVYAKHCVACHTASQHPNATSTQVGPDLSAIGTKLARTALFEAILYPSAAISHGYEMHAAELRDQTSVLGVLINETDLEIQLRDAQGLARTLDRAQLKSFTRMPVSLMPNNLHQLMATEELVDLVAHLTTLRQPTEVE